MTFRCLDNLFAERGSRAVFVCYQMLDKTIHVRALLDFGIRVFFGCFRHSFDDAHIPKSIRELNARHDVEVGINRVVGVVQITEFGNLELFADSGREFCL